MHIQNYRVIPLLIIMLWYCTIEANINELTNVFHHESALGDKIVFYFTDNIMFNRLPNRLASQLPNDIEALTIFVPMAKMTNQAKTKVDQINKLHFPFYTMNIEEVSKPIQGIKINISYQKNAVIFDFEPFEAIHTHKGFAFVFHSKEKLENLKCKTDPILKTAQINPPLIVIDCGHGGSDCGKIGCFNIKEKEITLDVGLQLGKLLAESGYKTQLTRSDDSFIPLDQRTSVANKMKADLFISLHANAGAKESTCGIETYYCNAKPSNNISIPSPLLTDWYNHKNKESCLLAQTIHTTIISHARTMYNLTDRMVKQAHAQVLLGTDMPAILIELGFLTNPHEAQVLNHSSYKKLIAQAICTGIETYYKPKNLL